MCERARSLCLDCKGALLRRRVHSLVALQCCTLRARV